MFLSRKKYNYEKEVEWYKNQLAIKNVKCLNLEKTIEALNNRIENQNKIIDNCHNENTKLVDWIFKILQEFGTMEVKEQYIKIPIIKEQPYKAYNNLSTEEYEQITIPTITFVKIRS